MQKLKEIYEIKKQLVNEDITKLGDILKENSNINTIDVNSDNTIYLESNCGLDSIKDVFESEVRCGFKMFEAPFNRIYNILPISNNSCIIRI